MAPLRRQTPPAARPGAGGGEPGGQGCGAQRWLRASTIAVAFSLFPLSLFLPGTAEASQATENRQFPIRRGDTIVVENDYGRVQVRAAATDQVQARIRRIGADLSALENVLVVSERAGSRIFFHAFFYQYRSESVYLDLEVPEWANLSVWGANPAVEVTGLSGYVRVLTQTGLITGEDLRSAVSLNTESGSILFRSRIQPEKEIRLESVQGNVRCELAPGLHFRGWLRAGGKLSWNQEVELESGQLEKQVGLGGPLLYAASLGKNVELSLKLAPDPPDSLAIRRPPAPVSTPDRAPDPLPRPEPAPRSGREAPPRPLTPPDPAPHQDSPPPQVQVPTREGETPGGGYRLRVDVNWTYLHASVRDRATNRSVPNLRQEDFLIYEDGQLQRVEKFETQNAPYNLLLLLDVSGSTRPYLNLIKEASIQFTRQINSRDRIGIAVFNSRSDLIQPFTNDRSRVARSIGRIRSGGGTAFYDALDRSIHDYMAGLEGRNAIVVFTDGVDNQLSGDWSDGSRTTFPELYRSVQEIDSIIYTIFLDTAGVSGRGRRSRRRVNLADILGDIMRGGRSGGGRGGQYAVARRQLQQIADQTGGRMYSPGRISDLNTVYSEIADDLRIQYTLAYSPTNSKNNGEWRRIRVRIRDRSDLAVRTRRGYYSRSRIHP